MKKKWVHNNPTMHHTLQHMHVLLVYTLSVHIHLDNTQKKQTSPYRVIATPTTRSSGRERRKKKRNSHTVSFITFCCVSSPVAGKLWFCVHTVVNHGATFQSTGQIELITFCGRDGISLKCQRALFFGVYR